MSIITIECLFLYYECIEDAIMDFLLGNLLIIHTVVYKFPFRRSPFGLQSGGIANLKSTMTTVS